MRVNLGVTFVGFNYLLPGKHAAGIMLHSHGTRETGYTRETGQFCHLNAVVLLQAAIQQRCVKHYMIDEQCCKFLLVTLSDELVGF